MKYFQELKNELHEYIERVDDEGTLLMVREELVEYLKKDLIEEDIDEDDYLTGEQEKELDEAAIRQADAGEFVSEEEYLKATARWRTK